MICQNCNEKNIEAAVFCRKCGKRMVVLEQEVANDKKTCVQCGSELNDDDCFCMQCGAAVESSIKDKSEASTDGAINEDNVNTQEESVQISKFFSRLIKCVLAALSLFVISKMIYSWIKSFYLCKNFL